MCHAWPPFTTFLQGNLMRKMTFLLTLLASLMHTAFAEINLAELEAKLKTDGLVGEIHGSITDSKIFVLTYRNPNDFFDNIQLPLTSDLPDVLATLNQVKRHQFYIVKGEFITNKAPIKHINISSLKLSKDYTSELDHLPYQYKQSFDIRYDPNM